MAENAADVGRQNVLVSEITRRANEFVTAWRLLEDACYAVNVAHGFEDDICQNVGEKIALAHAELSEALEALRHGNPPDSHIPAFSGMEAEFADAVIRIMNISKGRSLRTAEAIVAKTQYNAQRPYKHNKAF